MQKLELLKKFKAGSMTHIEKLLFLQLIFRSFYQVYFSSNYQYKSKQCSYKYQICFFQLLMKQHSASPINCTNLCRPLLTTSYQLQKSKGDQTPPCIELPYNYQLNDIRNLETYLCNSIKIIGIDFLQRPIPFPKLKYKNILISSIGENREKIDLKSVNNYEKLNWLIDIVTAYPDYFNQPRVELKKKLIKSIHFYSSKQELITESLISLQKLKQSKINCLIKRQKSKKQQKMFICRVPVRILLPSLKQYDMQNISSIICEDLSNAIDIMIRNSIMYRVINWHQNIIPIQNFFKTQPSALKTADIIFENLSNFNQNRRTSKQQKYSKDTNEKILIEKEKLNSNVFLTAALILVLITLIGGYAYIKTY